MHPRCKNHQSPRNPSPSPNSANLFCSGAPSSFHLSLSIVAPTSSCRDDLSRRPHAPFSVGASTASSPSSISHTNGLKEFVRASLAGPPPDAAALPLCPVCDIASGQSCFDCEQQFCANHIYSCADCGNQFCGDCLDAHHADGHWSDSDTASELAAARAVVRASSVNLLDLLRSEPAVSQRAARSSSASELAAARAVVRASSVNSLDLLRSEPAVSQRAARSSSTSKLASQCVPSSSSVDLRCSRPVGSNQHPQASWLAVPVKLKSLLSQRLTRVATLISFMVQNVALQSEASS